jgi:N6-adenosine-specific RNA methylase IME4
MKIDIEFKSLIPPLKQDEYDLLEQNILTEGCHDALVLWLEEDILLDGHNRYEICIKHNLPFSTRTISLSSRNAAMDWIDTNQLGRRNLSPDQMSIIRGRLYNRMKKDVGKPLGTILAQNEPISTATILSEQLGVSPATIKRDGQIAVFLDEHPVEAEAVLQGDKTLTDIRKELKTQARREYIDKQRAEIEAGAVEKPKGVFEVLVLDVPWPYGTEYDPEARRAANPYPEVSLEEIAALSLPTAEDCILWFWTTHKFMRYSFALIDGWGFRDVMILTWVKDRMGLGTWLRSQSEFCIMAVKGKPIVDLTNQTTIISGPLREHSRKPDEFYTMVDSLCIGRKLDFFSRAPRKGWEQYGNELTKF